MTQVNIKYSGKDPYQEFNKENFPDGTYFQFDGSLYVTLEWGKNDCKVLCFDWGHLIVTFFQSNERICLKISKVDITCE